MTPLINSESDSLLHPWCACMVTIHRIAAIDFALLTIWLDTKRILALENHYGEKHNHRLKSEPPAVAIGVVIPALNAAVHLPDLLQEIHFLHADFKVLVVDDGSQDGTAEVSRSAGAEVAQHSENRGKGAALDTGHRWALAEKLTWLYTMDADGQHLPAEMDRFLSAAEYHRLDVVVGTRMANAADMPWIRKVTNKITSSVISWLAGCRIPDSQSGYRLLRVKCLEGLTLRTRRYDTESEILVRLAWRGCRIGSVPISTVYGEEKSAIRPLVDTGRFVRLVYWLLHDRHRQTSGTRSR